MCMLRSGWVFDLESLEKMVILDFFGETKSFCRPSNCNVIMDFPFFSGYELVIFCCLC